MEKTRSMREDTDGKVVFPHKNRYSNFDVLVLFVLVPICTFTSRVNNNVSRQAKTIKIEMKVQKTQLLFKKFEGTDDNIQ